MVRIAREEGNRVLVGADAEFRTQDPTGEIICRNVNPSATNTKDKPKTKVRNLTDATVVVIALP